MSPQLAKKLTASAIAVSLSNGLYAAPGDYSPTSAARPSPGFFNDWLRKDDPYMSAWDLGAQFRLRYEVRDGFGIAGSPGSTDFRADGVDTENAYLLTRVRPRLGYTAEWYSFMLEGRDSQAISDERTPSPEEDSFDLHQAYVTIGNHKEFPVSLKIGRQELLYGDERLVGAFAWNNIGRVFDAAKVRWQNAIFGADFFTSKLVLPDDNNLNWHNDDEWFSGMYATSKKIPKMTTDLYLLSRNANEGSNVQPGSLVPGATPRDIYTLGMRLLSNPGEFGPWDFSSELMGQIGHYTDPILPIATRELDHEAFATFVRLGYTMSEMLATPRFGLEYNYASGDDNPRDGKHETFDNLYPTNHKFYGFMDFVSLQNIHNIRLSNSLKPLPRLSLLTEWHSFWLATTDDNFYAVSGARRGGIAATTGRGYGINSGNDSYIGSEIDFVVTYSISPQMVLEAGYGHFFTGSYIDQSLSSPVFGSKDADWVYLSLNISF